MSSEQSNSGSYVLRDVFVLDDLGGFTDPIDVSVKDGVIVSVGPNGSGDGPSIDGSGLWLLPGIFDCHAHLACFTEDVLTMLEMPVTRWTLEVARTARQLLDLGITFVRDPGSSDAGIRDGLAAGAVAGPTLRVSGPPIGQTGGHTDGYLPGLDCHGVTSGLIPNHPGLLPYLADGSDEMRRVVRTHLRGRVDWIKLCTTGGLLSSAPDRPDVAELTAAEVETAVDEAARAGVPVAAHAYGGLGVTTAVEAGVRSLEHGIDLTEEQASLMAERGCWLVPTLAVFDQLAEFADAGTIDPNSAARVREVFPRRGRAVEIARHYGVRIAMGTDLVRQGSNLTEIRLMHEAGLTVEESLLAATANGAALCGVEATHGRITPGFVFDAILIDEDPSDLRIFDRPEVVVGVFQRGKPVRADARLTESADAFAAR
jgi:imidazolonepropionase-like amidohydrolase